MAACKMTKGADLKEAGVLITQQVSFELLDNCTVSNGTAAGLLVHGRCQNIMVGPFNGSAVASLVALSNNTITLTFYSTSDCQGASFATQDFSNGQCTVVAGLPTAAKDMKLIWSTGATSSPSIRPRLMYVPPSWTAPVTRTPNATAIPHSAT